MFHTIVDAFFNLLLAPIKLLISALPTIGVSMPDGVFEALTDTMAFIGYMLPVQTIITCFGIRLGMSAFRQTVAIIVRVKSFIPTMGS